MSPINALMPNDVQERISEALYARRKIEAVRLYRETVRVGLADAKREVEKIEAELRKASPEKFDPYAGRSQNWIRLILIGHCVAVVGLSIASWDVINGFIHGAPLASIKMMMPFCLVCSTFGAANAFRTQWPKL